MTTTIGGTNNLNSGRISNQDKKTEKDSFSVNDKLIEALEKQKEVIKEQVQDIKGKKMDETLKRTQINELQKQICQIDSRIAELKAQKLNPKEDNEKAADTPKKQTETKESKESEQLNKLVKVFSSASQLSKMNEIKKHMKQQVNVILHEPDLIRGDYSQYKIDSMEKLSGNIVKIDKEIDKKIKEINSNLKDNNKITEGHDESDDSQENDKIDTYV